ncbi:MAG: DUF4352 domain-containing protein [Candidatus Eremiobacteraeota bacterium]|nr:DUF4352 domain-containing protein [Candidatus Eremiobacteraeota bacterium]
MTALVFALTILAADASPPAATTEKSLCVRVPTGISRGFVIESPAKDAGMKYLVIQDVVIPNASKGTVSYNLDDFTLTAGSKKYHPVARPGLGAIDISEGGVLGPRQRIKGNLAFLVPQALLDASLEFRPSNWYVNGIPAIWCCAWQCH